MLCDEARENLRVNMAGLSCVPPGTPEALPHLGESVGRDRNTGAVLVQADVDSWGHRREHRDSCVLPCMGWL